MSIFIVLLILAGLIFFWLDSMNSHEKAVRAAQLECQKINVQLLDQTVSLMSLKPMRNRRGRVIFQRIYGFDFSVHGVERRQGRAVMQGQQLKQVQLDYDEGMVIEDRSE